MKLPEWASDEEAQALFREAQTLLGDQRAHVSEPPKARRENLR